MKKDINDSIFGGDLIRLKHTELFGNLSSDLSYYSDEPEVYLRTYKGEYNELENSVSSVWQIEMNNNIVMIFYFYKKINFS